MAHFDTAQDAVYMPEAKQFEHYEDYVQELMRQVAGATGHAQRLAREGMVMQGGKAPSEDAIRYERLVAELASGVKMMELGLPARLANDSLPLVEHWTRELQENPHYIDAIESDVNNALGSSERRNRVRKWNMPRCARNARPRKCRNGKGRRWTPVRVPYWWIFSVPEEWR